MTTNTIYFDSHSIGRAITSEDITSFDSLGFGLCERVGDDYCSFHDIPQSMLFVALSFMKERFNVRYVCVFDSVESFGIATEENCRQIFIGDSKKDALSFKDLYELARANYENGGDTIVECWDERTFNDYVREFGPITEKDALEMFSTCSEIEKDSYGTSEFYSGNYNEYSEKSKADNSEKTEKDASENEKYYVYFTDIDEKRVIVEYFATEEDAKNYINSCWGWYPSRIDDSELMYLYCGKIE